MYEAPPLNTCLWFRHSIFVHIHDAQNANITFSWKALGIVRTKKRYSLFSEIFLALWLVFDPPFSTISPFPYPYPFPVLVWRSFKVRFFQTLIFPFISYPLWPPPPTHSAVDLNGFIIRFVRLKCTFWKTKKFQGEGTKNVLLLGSLYTVEKEKKISFLHILGN